MSGTTVDLHRELYRGIAYSVGNAYNNLIKFTDVESFSIAGEIATGLPEQVDDLTYNFTIRDDVKWHNKAPANGRALTMDDVKWNFERQTAGELANGETALKNIEGLKPFFRLSPPKGGYKISTRRSSGQGGVLGQYSNLLTLTERMLEN